MNRERADQVYVYRETEGPFKLESIEIKDGYKLGSYNNDLAIATLKEPLIFGKSISAITVASTAVDNPLFGTEVTAIYYGSPLHQTQATILSTGLCFPVHLLCTAYRFQDENVCVL